MDNGILAKAETLVADNLLLESIVVLEEHIDKVFSPAIFMLRKRYAQNQKDHILGQVTYEQFVLSGNKIAKSILDLIAEIRSSSDNPISDAASKGEGQLPKKSKVIVQKGQKNIIITGDFTGNLKL